MTGDWAEAVMTLSDDIEATDAVYADLVAGDDPAISEAAADLLRFDQAIVSSRALDAASAQEFAETVSGLPGSAEAGAADAVLKEYARENCGFADDDG